MNRLIVSVLVLLMATASMALGQKGKEEEDPTSWLYFNVIKDDNGKPVRNAAVILHAVNAKGKQQNGDLELKTSPEGKADLDGIPYGKLRVQIIASGFQTFGEDYEISQTKTEITIKLKRPQSQFSVYEDHPNVSQKPNTSQQNSNPPADPKKPD